MTTREGKYCETGKVAQWLSEFENIELQLAYSGNINWDDCGVKVKA